MNLAWLVGIGAQELLIILLIVVLIFGASRIPQLMRGLGTGIKEFKDAVKEDDKPAQGQETKSSAEERPSTEETKAKERE